MHIPPPVYMFLAIIGMHYGAQLLPFLSFQFTEQFILSYALALFGIFILALTVLRYFRRRTTIQPNKLDQMSTLVTDGVNRYSRNPMYLAMLLLILSAGLYWGTFLVLIAAPAFVMVINKMQIEPEEEALEAIFGQDYLDYKQRVRRWM
ncbi:MAG: isoprenylcysteine carboxylmethyltransferase family protein [Lentilitoribacter sp.]